MSLWDIEWLMTTSATVQSSGGFLLNTQSLARWAECYLKLRTNLSARDQHCFQSPTCRVPSRHLTHFWWFHFAAEFLRWSNKTCVSKFKGMWKLAVIKFPSADKTEMFETAKSIFNKENFPSGQFADLAKLGRNWGESSNDLKCKHLFFILDLPVPNREQNARNSLYQVQVFAEW